MPFRPPSKLMKATGRAIPFSRRTADLAKPLVAVLGLVIAIAALPGLTLAGQKTLKLEPEMVRLCGTTAVREIKDGDGKIQRPFLLELDAPVRVAGDQFGDESDEKVMQIVVKGDNFKQLVLDFGGKKACITGELYRGFNIHHLTDVLIILRKIELETPKGK